MSESHRLGRALKERSITDPTAARWYLKVTKGKGDEWQPQTGVWSHPWEASRLSSATPILKATSCGIPAKMSTFSGYNITNERSCRTREAERVRWVYEGSQTICQLFEEDRTLTC